MASCQLGRGRIPPYKFSRYSTGHRFGRPGDFQPHEEATSVLHKQIVRQMRRIHSLTRILKKNPNVTHNPVALADCSAILKAPGFSPCFPTWALKTGLDTSFMDTLACLVEGYLDETSKLARTARIESLRKDLNHSRVSQTNRLGYRLIGPSSNPPIQSACKSFQLVLNRCRSRLKGPATYSCSPGTFHPGDIVYLGDLPLRPVSPICGRAQTPPSLHVRVERWSDDPDSLHSMFFRFWESFSGAPWSPPANPSHFQDFSDFSEQWKILIDPHVDVQHLQSCIKETWSKSSQGADGWSQPELECLPPRILQDWCDIFNECISGSSDWSEVLTLARVCIPSKVPTHYYYGTSLPC